MDLKDLGSSVFLEMGSDASDSFYDHVALLGRLAFSHFMRAGRNIPRGVLEEATLRYHSRMLNMFDGKGCPIVILPIEDVPVKIIDIISRIATEVFGVSVKIFRRRTVWPEAYDPSLKRVDANVILSKAIEFTKHGRVLVVTDHELHAVVDKKDQWVYGYGSMMTPVCVVSTFGLGKLADIHIPWSRLVKLVVHEICHTFGLVHHDSRTTNIPCVMNIGPTVDGRPGIDIMPHYLCSICLEDVLAGRSQYQEKIRSEDTPCLEESSAQF